MFWVYLIEVWLIFNLLYLGWALRTTPKQLAIRRLFEVAKYERWWAQNNGGEQMPPRFAQWLIQHPRD